MRETIEAVCGISYGGQWRAAGARFEASRADARVLVAVGRARRVQADGSAPADDSAVPSQPGDEPVQSEPAPEVGTKDMTTDEGEAEPGPQTVGAVTTGRGKYKRRDLRAEK